MLRELEKKFNELADPVKAKVYQKFFKTGKGEYGESDVFIGLSVPQQRKLAKEFAELSFSDIEMLLSNKIHEYRLTGFFILVYKFEKADEKGKKNIVDFYLKNIDSANNWDLIDCISDKLLGKYLIDKNKEILYEFAESDSLWKKRIAIISTFEFIKNYKFEDTLKISEILLTDNHDLIHKAVGWMLREIGKKNQNVLENFLKKHYKNMSRTMLRYAIEKFDEEKRKMYLKGKFKTHSAFLK